MKKILITALAALLLLLTACGGGAKAPEPAAPTEAPAAENAPEPGPETAEEPEEEPEEEPAPQAEEEPAQAPEEPDAAILGEWDGRTYRNAFLGVTYRQPESWTHLERDQLLQLSGLAAEQIADEEIAARIVEAGEKGVTLYLLYAGAPDGSVNCNLVLENLSSLAALTVTEEGYVDLARPQLEEALTAAGMTELTSEKDTVLLAGSQRPCLRITGVINGVSMTEIVAVQKAEGYMACYSFAAARQEELEKTVAAWSAME